MKKLGKKMKETQNTLKAYCDKSIECATNYYADVTSHNHYSAHP